jgi:hypothetical protein
MFGTSRIPIPAIHTFLLGLILMLLAPLFSASIHAIGL